MADRTRLRDIADATCWQCGASADAGCAYTLVLVAGQSRGLDALGHSVERDARLDKVRVPVPRCARCRLRNQLSVMICFGGAALGAIVFPVLLSRFWPHIETPTWLSESHEGVGGTRIWIGAVLGFVVALMGVALHRRFSGFRSLNLYPTVVMLRQAGWHYPT